MKQSLFAAALLDPAAALPDGLIDPQGRPAPRRFAVYRNNVASSLTRALEAGFPVIRLLVGEVFFGAMAVVYLRAHPPVSRQIALYGHDFPAFLASFPPVAHLPYLADTARLELALRDSYHAADAEPLDPAALAQPEAVLLACRFHLAPSLRLVRSDYPVHAIWMANSRGTSAPRLAAQDVVVLRAEFDPEPLLLPPGGHAFLSGLLAGQTLAQALHLAGDGFDLTAVLSLLLANRSLTGVSR